MENKTLKNLHQIQEFITCNIFNAEPFEDEEKNEKLNQDMYTALSIAIRKLECPICFGNGCKNCNYKGTK